MNDNSSVSSFHPLGNETVKQKYLNRNTSGNNRETYDLKSLADKVFERNSCKNENEIIGLSSVSSVTAYETDLSDYRDLFEERASIYQFESGMMEHEAESWALREVLEVYMKNCMPDVYHSLVVWVGG